MVLSGWKDFLPACLSYASYVAVGWVLLGPMWADGIATVGPVVMVLAAILLFAAMAAVLITITADPGPLSKPSPSQFP